MRRRASLLSFPGAYVFPGGKVDDRDDDPRVVWTEDRSRTIAEAPDSDRHRARPLATAAVREVFEETSVFLGVSEGDHAKLADRRALPDARQKLEGGEWSLGDILDGSGITLRENDLRYWSRWVTPVFQPRRFDTRFFIARMPDGQDPQAVSPETDDADWATVREVILRARAGELALFPPTYATCLELFDFDSVEDALNGAAFRDRTPIVPDLLTDDLEPAVWMPRHLLELDSRVHQVLEGSSDAGVSP